MDDKPNAFVSVRITSKEIRKEIEKVQDALVGFDPDMKKFLASLDTLHLTLMVMCLPDKSEIERAKSVLDKVTRKVVQDHQLLTNPLELTLKGLGTFGGKVLFAQIAEGPSKERLKAITQDVRDAFTSENFQGVHHNHPYYPHLTIADKPPTGGIESEVCASFQGVEFGRQTIKDLELLQMGTKDKDGYYPCYKRNQFSDFD